MEKSPSDMANPTADPHHGVLHQSTRSGSRDLVKGSPRSPTSPLAWHGRTCSRILWSPFWAVVLLKRFIRRFRTHRSKSGTSPSASSHTGGRSQPTRERIEHVVQVLNATEGSQSLVTTLLEFFPTLRASKEEPLRSQGPSEIQSLLDAIQEASITASSEKRVSLFQVLLWISAKHDQHPSRLFIKDGVECSGREDYGSGGMCDIYCGTYKDKKMALKHSRAFGMVVPSRRELLRKTFLYDALVWYNLRHKHIVSCFGVANVPLLTDNCFVLSWCEFGNARRYLEKEALWGLSGEAYLKRVTDILYETALGLEYLHQMEVVHGELRGAKILIEEGGSACLTGFGSTTDSAASENRPTHAEGSSTHWLAPEVIDPERFGFSSAKPTPESDIYSLACTCVELFTRSSPFEGLIDAKIISSVLAGRRPHRPSTPNEISDELWALINSCWHKDPSKRRSAREVAHLFRQD